MNNYPEWWNDTITVYNKYEDQVTKVVTWYKTIIPSCFWKYVGDKVKIGDSIIETNSTICRIPKLDNFVEKYQWINLSEIDKAKYFTAGIGDIVVRGRISEDIDEYKKGQRSSDFVAKIKKMQGCFIVEEVSINVGGGRGDEHYLLKGV